MTVKPCIAIPTYNRPNAVALHRVKPVGLPVFLFVRREQLDMYRDWSKVYTLVPMDDVSEIGETRRFVVKYLYEAGYKWVFMLDDDISKVEMLAPSPKGGWNSRRILEGSKEPPRMEKEAFQLWYNLARKYHLSLSSPNHRAYDRSYHGAQIRINKSAVIQCVLLNTHAVMEVGNYRNINETGNEDYYIQYQLMTHGHRVGKIGLIEYDCPSIGNVADGSDDPIVKKYKRYIKAFKKNVCNDESLVSTKTTKTGIPSLKFVWKNWGGKVIGLEE